VGVILYSAHNLDENRCIYCPSFVYSVLPAFALYFPFRFCFCYLIVYTNSFSLVHEKSIILYTCLFGSERTTPKLILFPQSVSFGVALI